MPVKDPVRARAARCGRRGSEQQAAVGCGRFLQAQEEPLAAQAARVTGQLSACTYDAMVGAAEKMACTGMNEAWQTTAP